MFTSFQRYTEVRRPLLDAALSSRIAAILPHGSSTAGCDLHPALTGGKKLRGILLGMIAEILGGDWDWALPRAVAVELIQAATLIHDDFVDQDRIRRRLPAVWTLAGARRAVLMGDVIFASAIRMMSEIGPDDGRILSRAIAEIARGALMEPVDPARLGRELAAGGLDGGAYEKIIRLKTAVLFEAACELGAVCADAGAEARRCCVRYGARIGEAYQMADDLKEIRRHLASGAIRASEMAPLTPALLCFARESRPHIAPVLAGARRTVSRMLREQLLLAEKRMQRDIRRRLDRAADEMRALEPGRRLAALGLSAPGELLEMFDRSEAAAGHRPSRRTLRGRAACSAEPTASVPLTVSRPTRLRRSPA